jgi:hypothetical protein
MRVGWVLDYRECVLGEFREETIVLQPASIEGRVFSSAWKSCCRRRGLSSAEIMQGGFCGVVAAHTVDSAAGGSAGAAQVEAFARGVVLTG